MASLLRSAKIVTFMHESSPLWFYNKGEGFGLLLEKASQKSKMLDDQRNVIDGEEFTNVSQTIFYISQTVILTIVYKYKLLIEN
jgi:hypothetical protein